MPSKRPLTCVTASRAAQVTCFHPMPGSSTPSSSLKKGRIIPTCATLGTQSTPRDATRSPGHGKHSGWPVDVSRTSPLGHGSSASRSSGTKALSCQRTTYPSVGRNALVSEMVPARCSLIVLPSAPLTQL